MKSLFAVFILLTMLNCETRHYVQKITPKSSSKPSSPDVILQTETEFEQLMKTHKPETAKVLEDLLNGSDGSANTSISVENNSVWNMVLTVSGPIFFKKIPIPAGKIGTTMVPKNQTYNISGMVCRSLYQQTKFIDSSYSVTISN